MWVRSGRGFDSPRLHQMDIAADEVNFSLPGVHPLGPTWFRRGEETDADDSEGDARYAHNLRNANDERFLQAA